MKTCKKCNKSKALSEFQRRKDSPDGYRNDCKRCRLEYQRKYHKGEIKKVVYQDGDGKKQCRACMEVLPVDNFGKSKQNKDGLKSYCKKCKAKESAAWRNKNEEYYVEYRKENKDIAKEYHKIYREENKKELAVKYKEYYDENKNKISKYKRKWYNKNKEKVKDGKRRRRDRQAGYGENYTLADSKITMNAFDNKCFNCGCEENLHIDHHRPLILGFPLSVDNAVVLCEYCNKSKSTKMPEIFYGKEVCAYLDNSLAKLKNGEIIKIIKE